MTFELHSNQKCLAATNTLLIFSRLLKSYVMIGQEEIFNTNRASTNVSKMKLIFDLN